MAFNCRRCELSQTAACRKYGLGCHTLKKILAQDSPPGYRQSQPRRKRKLRPFLSVIHQVMADDRQAPKKPRRIGTVRCLYAEALDHSSLDRLTIRRAGHLEPTENGRWTADLTPIGGPLLGPFGTRTQALAAETGWIEAWLVTKVGKSSLA